MNVFEQTVCANEKAEVKHKRKTNSLLSRASARLQLFLLETTQTNVFLMFSLALSSCCWVAFAFFLHSVCKPVNVSRLVRRADMLGILSFNWSICCCVGRQFQSKVIEVWKRLEPWNSSDPLRRFFVRGQDLLKIYCSREHGGAWSHSKVFGFHKQPCRLHSTTVHALGQAPVPNEPGTRPSNIVDFDH